MFARLVERKTDLIGIRACSICFAWIPPTGDADLFVRQGAIAAMMREHRPGSDQSGRQLNVIAETQRLADRSDVDGRRSHFKLVCGKLIARVFGSAKCGPKIQRPEALNTAILRLHFWAALPRAVSSRTGSSLCKRALPDPIGQTQGPDSWSAMLSNIRSDISC
jgi:hypothetical protein